MSEPLEVRAGDRWTWTRSDTDHPAPTWTLTYSLRKGANTLVTIIAAASGADHAVSVAAATTAQYAHGVYDWIARADDGAGVLETIASGRLRVLPNLALAGVDHRTFSQQALDALEAAMLDRAGSTQGSVSIEGRSISWQSWEELEAQYARFKNRVARELGLRPSRIFVRTGVP